MALSDYGPKHYTAVDVLQQISSIDTAAMRHAGNKDDKGHWHNASSQLGGATSIITSGPYLSFGPPWWQTLGRLRSIQLVDRLEDALTDLKGAKIGKIDELRLRKLVRRLHNEYSRRPGV